MLTFHCQAPKFDFVSNAKPSLFAYPSLTKTLKKEAVTKVTTAVYKVDYKIQAAAWILTLHRMPELHQTKVLLHHLWWLQNTMKIIKLSLISHLNDF
jgi:hypothetical protein